MERQLFWGPISEWLAPFWGAFKLFFKNKKGKASNKTELFKNFCTKVGFGHKKVAAPQTGFLKEIDFPRAVGLLGRCFVGQQLFWGARFVSGWRRSGALLNFSLKRPNPLAKLNFLKNFCFK